MNLYILETANERIDRVTPLLSLPDICLRVQQLIDSPNDSLGDTRLNLRI